MPFPANIAVMNDNAPISPFFTSQLQEADPEIFEAIQQEYQRQHYHIEMIASENLVSNAVLQAQGSVLTNKYAEGYPGKRYYGGCEFVDIAEAKAIERACKLFGCSYANVQPNSGSQANQAVLLALLQPGDTILGMDLNAGGHLTHGSRPNLSGKWFNAVTYGVREDTHLIDYDAVEKLALEHKPKMIICGASAYPRTIDFARFREIADKAGAILMADVAHYAGLIVAGAYPSPFPHAHVVTTTTHKTLRGPRGGMILADDADLGKKLNSAVFPGLQGGPLMHVIAAKAVAFKEALQPEFKLYAETVVKNAQVLAQVLSQNGLGVITDGTDSHMVLVDLRPLGLKGNVVSDALDRIGITCNKNSVPFETEKPTITSGIRLGTPAPTTRGFKPADFLEVGTIISEFLLDMRNEKTGEAVESKYRAAVHALCDRYPIYHNGFARNQEAS
ncbi:MAG: glyA [Alphaproteobacteria bacterium]|nr:glyA [Alphaproteobacteria bacterium]